MKRADARSEELAAETAALLARLPGAWCLVKPDRYLTLAAANEAFYRLMGCSKDEMGFRYANRVSALWDAVGVESLARLGRDAAESAPRRFRHGLASGKDGRTMETEASLLADEGLLCCLMRDCTCEASNEASVVRYRALGSSVSEALQVEVFSYDVANRGARILFGESVLDQLPGAPDAIDDLPAALIGSGLTHPEDEEAVRHAFDHAASSTIRTACDVRLGGPGSDAGAWRWYRLMLVGGDEDPADGLVAGVLMDITAHKELAMSYLDETQFYYALLSEKDAYGHADITDDAILKIGGMWNLYNELIDTMTYTDVVETFIGRVVHPDDRAHYLDLMRRDNLINSLENGIDQLRCEFRRIVEQNQMAWMELNVHLLKDPVTNHVLALLSIKNIDKKKRQEIQMQSASQRDPLTQVLHKRAAEAAVRARLRSSAIHDTSALLILDIDDFKEINDRWGHQAGDKALVRFVHDVRCSAGRDDVLGRFGGDEFVLFVANAFDEEHVTVLLRGIFERLARWDDPTLTCSAGVALMPGGMTYDEGFLRADEALYEAKAAGKATFRFYRDGEGTVPTYSYERRRRALPDAADGEDGRAKAVLDGVAGGAHGENEPSFAEFLSVQGEIAYLVDPDTFTLICGNDAFYNRIGETPSSCLGMKCYEAMQDRATPCPFCSKANWTTDKFFMWRNDNKALDQEFLIKNKLVSWCGREVLLAIAVDVSNNKSIVDSLDSGVSETHCLLAGIQQMNAAPDFAAVVDRALEASVGFFRAGGARFWKSDRAEGTTSCVASWSRDANAPALKAPDDGSLDVWLAAQRWDEPVMVESPESVLSSSYPLYRYMKDNGIVNERWIKLKDAGDAGSVAYYLSVENLGANLQNVAFLESFSVFVASELDRRRMMEDLLHASRHDDLTGLLNRECYERLVEGFDGDQVRSVGVAAANVNDMRAINNAKGFSAGNYYLRQFAAMLLDAFPPECVFRLNGDEFAVLAPDVSREELENRMRDLRSMVASTGQFSVALGYSWDDVEKDLDVLMEQASRAMEADKKRYHDETHDRSDDDRRAELRDLVSSLDEGRFVMYLQPKARLSDGKVVGAEALVRYRDDELGIVSPARFIQSLEDSGLIRHVDLFVFQEVCRAVERWEREGMAVPVSFNFSRRTLLENDLAASMESIASRHELDRRNLEIEITESFAAIGKSVLYRAANDLMSAGFSLALDDFGTKYTDLSILTNIGFSVVKLDRSLIESIENDEAKRTVVKHVLGMCDDLGVDVVAEGVESAGQARVLGNLGCRIGQGYLYGRPVPVERFEDEFLRAAMRG